MLEQMKQLQDDGQQVEAGLVNRMETKEFQ
jgi:hypothetical protein